jgi:hypothetical protein
MLYYLQLLVLAPLYSLMSILLWRDQDRELLLLRPAISEPDVAKSVRV